MMLAEGLPWHWARGFPNRAKEEVQRRHGNITPNVCRAVPPVCLCLHSLVIKLDERMQYLEMTSSSNRLQG